jgi:hypothetical protein
MYGIELYELIQQFSTFNELLQSKNCETDSKRGNVFEKVCDLIIKFGFHPNFPNDTYDNFDANINTSTLKKVDNLEIYLQRKSVFGNGLGGSSDITLQHKVTEKWIFISSKFYSDDSNKSVSDYDVQTINSAVSTKHTQKYNNNYDVYLMVNDKQKVITKIKSSHDTSEHLIVEDDNRIFGLSDMEPYYKSLRDSIQNIPIDKVNSKFCNAKIPLELRFHQDLITYNQMERIGEGEKELLLGAKARSGKTYCVGGLIIKYHKKYDSVNALIITPCPTETLSQFTDDLFHKFKDFIGINIVEIKKGSDFKKTDPDRDNIIIVSKQRLQNYVFDKKIESLQKLNLDFIVFDENHFGGTTTKSKDILNSYSSPKTIKLYLTATFSKPLRAWDIPTDCQCYWDIEDEQICKKRNIQGLVERHGENVLLLLTEENKEHLLSVYDKMPDLHQITNMMDRKRYEVIKEKIKDTSYGFSHGTLLSGEFPNEVDQVLNYITGANKEKDYPGRDLSIFGRIKRHAIKNESRTLLNNGDFTTQLWFLPTGIVNMPIETISEHLKGRMEKNDVLKNYEILIVNSKKKTYNFKDIKEKIKNCELNAKKDGKHGLILLAGGQLTLGITLPFVDVVFLFNDTLSVDKIYQMMYRCMTESINNSDNDKINNGIKKMGFVVDMNISRVVNTCLDFNLVKNNKYTSEQKITYLVENNLINIDSDLFQGKEGNTKLIEKLLYIWKSDPINNLQRLMIKINNYYLEIESEDQKNYNRQFARSIGGGKLRIKINCDGDDNNQQPLPTGKKITKQCDGDNKIGKNEPDDDDDDKCIDISLTKDVIPFLLFLVCMLNIKCINHDILEMINNIIASPSLLDVFENQSCIWFNNPGIITLFKTIVEKYIKKNSPIYDIAIQFHMSLQSLIDSPKELLELIDSCLKPKDIEKKKFGEVFTPMNFINNNMLIDLETHYKEKYDKNIYEDETLTWGDTTTGMGNFPIAIYLKLMEGLKMKIPNEKDRKKHILENMLFMAEYNKKNCFIVKQILNLNSDYKLNLYEGDSLKLDIKKEFGIDKFDIVIGNPPYNEELTTKKGSATALYNKFVEYYIEKCDLLCFVIPSRWFSGGKGLDSFRKNMLERTDIVYIKHFDDASKIFGNTVEIKGGVNYFLKDMNHNGDCMYNGSMVNLNKYDVFVDGKYHNIIDKILKFNSIDKLFIGQSYSGVNSNDKRLNDTETETTLKCYVSKQKGFEKYIEKQEINKDRDFNKWKIITTRSSFGAGSGFGNMFIGKPNEICNQSYILFEVENEEEAKSLLTYMKCRLPNILLSLRKSSQDICKSTCKWIPLPPLNKEWTDEEVYQHFKLSEDDIKLINDTNIIGYKNIK